MTVTAAAPPTDRDVLTVDGLSVRYGRVVALREVTLSVRGGEVVAVVGPNGAGKSTLLAAVMGMVPWAAGQVAFRGSSLARLRSDQIARAGIALVPEGRQVFADLTVTENLRLGLVARPDRSGAADALERVRTTFPALARFAERPAGLLSGGQQQQLAIGRALLADPALILLDEPSLGLAPTVIDVVFEALDALRAEGRTILLVEQRAQRAIAFADRSVVLAGGEVRAELDGSAGSAGEVLRTAYFGDRGR